MSPAQSIFLGVLQGLGEFLPISSSGHLVVVPWLLGWPDHGLAFDVALHAGTLAAVLYAFARDWIRLGTDAWRGLVRGRPLAEPGGRLLALLAMASIPGVAAGIALNDWAETVLRSPALVGGTMAVMGLVLFWADRRAGQAHADRITTGHALLIGLSQALALFPGVSRSGATISMALFLGYRREEAARFSFLLATPITAGAALRKVPALIESPERGVALLGMIAAAVVGFISIRVLLAYVRTKDYRPFVIYRLVFAAAIAGVLLARR